MAEPPSSDHLTFRTILCAVDGTAKSVPLMKWASDLATDFGAALQVVHVVPAMSGLPSGHMDREFEKEAWKSAVDAMKSLQKSAGVNAPLCVATGSVADSIYDEARRHDADLVVIGRGVIFETLGRLRTHAYGIIRQTPCPVLSV